MQNRIITILLVCLVAYAVLFAGTESHAAREAKTQEQGKEDKGEYTAHKLFKRAEELLSAGERERSVEMLKAIIQQYPNSPIRFKAYLALGKHFFEAHEQTKAIDYLRNLNKLKKPDEEPVGEERDMYLEGLYLSGVSYFQMRQYNTTFSILRQITSNYPNSIWANQAHFYIGMSHFAQEHWNKAIKSLSLVGTFVDPDSPTVEFVEAGHRFHVKIIDCDLPILDRLGKKTSVEAETKQGDKEIIVCDALAGNSEIFLGSISTETGVAKPGDNILQVIGGDTITVKYLDDNTKEGKKDVLKKKNVRVVSSGSLSFTLGTYESKAPAAFLGQPLFIRLRDVDLDKTPDRDSATIRVAAMYKTEEEAAAPGMTVDIDKLLREEKEEELHVRDEVMLQLSEAGDPPVHSGILIGSIPIERASEEKPANNADGVLSCAPGDEIVATYMDELHVGGDTSIEITTKTIVAGEIDSTPRAAQNVVSDQVVRAKKEMVEAEAYLELARIFKSMGLMNGAKEKAVEGLDRVQFTLRTESPIPGSLKEQAFKLKWELHLAQDDFSSAMATCQVFNKLYPESPFVDHALMGIGKVFIERKKYDDAINVFKQVLALPNSHSKAEAQFRIAEVTETRKDRIDQKSQERQEAAIREYKLCASKYPDSEFAGPSLGKVVDYHVETKDYVVADDLLEQIFIDYQDEGFLDSMLLKWALVSYRTGNYQKAYEKCSQLIFEYPGSRYADEAKVLLPKIEQKLGRSVQNEG